MVQGFHYGFIHLEGSSNPARGYPLSPMPGRYKGGGLKEFGPQPRGRGGDCGGTEGGVQELQDTVRGTVELLRVLWRYCGGAEGTLEVLRVLSRHYKELWGHWGGTEGNYCGGTVGAVQVL